MRLLAAAGLSGLALLALTAEQPAVPRGDVGPVSVHRALGSDFNGDGVEDVALGMPGDVHPDMYRPGSLAVRYGAGPSGAVAASNLFSYQTPGLSSLLRMYPGGVGSQVASGDFDHDGYADVLVGIPGYDEPDQKNMRINVGGVLAVYGTSAGLDPRGAQRAQIWSQDSPGVQDVSEDDDNFGSSLAVADFDGDGYLDAAIGANNERTGPGDPRSGSLTVLFGGRFGLTARDQVLTQDTRGILDSAEKGDGAASALAAGDFNGDGVGDLAVGVGWEDYDGEADTGAVNVIYGMRGIGLTGRGDRFVTQALAAVPGETARAEHFGASLTVGDFNGDRRDDLAIAAPEETVGGTADAGTVTVIDGAGTGLNLASSRLLTLQGGGTADRPGEGAARFGASLAAGDVDDDGYDELAVGSPAWNARAGRVDVFAGSPAGIGAVRQTLMARDHPWSDLVSGTWDEWLPGMSFGATVQLGAFDTTPGADLLVGVPSATLVVDGQRVRSAGAAFLAYARAGILGSERSEWLRQGASGLPGVPDTGERVAAAIPGSDDSEGR